MIQMAFRYSFTPRKFPTLMYFTDQYQFLRHCKPCTVNHLNIPTCTPVFTKVVAFKIDR